MTEQSAYVLVPREPTEEMIAAGWIDKEDVNPDEIWAAMIAASPPAPVDDARLLEIRERCEKATPGPWQLADNDPTIVITEALDSDGNAELVADVLTHVGVDLAKAEANARLIAHARQDIPYLLDTIASLQARVQSLDAIAGDCCCGASAGHVHPDTTRLRAAEAERDALQARVQEVETDRTYWREKWARMGIEAEGLVSRLAAAEAERDRLRSALKTIDADTHGDANPDAQRINRIARAALKDTTHDQ